MAHHTRLLQKIGAHASPGDAMVFTETNLDVLAKPATVVIACGLGVTNSLEREEKEGRKREGEKRRKERGKGEEGKKRGGREAGGGRKRGGREGGRKRGRNKGKERKGREGGREGGGGKEEGKEGRGREGMGEKRRGAVVKRRDINLPPPSSTSALTLTSMIGLEASTFLSI